MYNLEKVNTILAEFNELVAINLESVKIAGDLSQAMLSDDVDKTKYIIKNIHKTVSRCVPQGLDVAGATIYITLGGNDSCIRVVGLSLKNKRSEDFEFKMKADIVYSERIFEEVSDFIVCAYNSLLTDALIRANLEVVNSTLANICKDAGLSFKVSFISPLGRENKKIEKITDDELVYVAVEERVFDIDDLVIFADKDNEELAESYKNEYDYLVSKFASVQTTPQFVDMNVSLVSYLGDISDYVKAFTLIRKVNTKNIEKVTSKNSVVVANYFDKENSIYALIRVSHGNREIVLSPFNTSTLEVVDLDETVKGKLLNP